jgi:hypothetical protein
VHLEVSLNKLHGSLPDVFSALKALEVVGFTFNLLTGTVPSSWASMTSLELAMFAGNVELSGCLPKSWEAQFAAVGDKYMPRDTAKLFLTTGTNIAGYCTA